MGEQAPDLFAAIGIVAGVALHASHDAATAFMAMRGNVSATELANGSATPVLDGAAHERLRVAIWTGVRDRVVAPLNAMVLAEQFRALVGLEDRIGEPETRDDAEIVRFRDARGRVRVETWQIPSMGHAWSGGSFRGSHTHPRGPRASNELMAFFLQTTDEPVGSLAP